jgi:hypothetical protein
MISWVIAHWQKAEHSANPEACKKNDEKAILYLTNMAQYLGYDLIKSGDK